ncbi:MAG: hypothetical protein WCD80_12210 [Desulfobaccales bacterium]
MFLSKIRERQLMPEIQKRRELYESNLSPVERKALQLAKFNSEWQVIKNTVPYYQSLARSHNLPEVFHSWEEIISSFPVANRSTLQQYRELMSSRTKAPEWWRLTGGTTAQPVQLPAWKSESLHTAPNTWLGRSWFGVTPSDRAFMLWGHSHLLGTGLKGRWNSYARRLKDWLLGYYRFSAYNLNERSMQEAGLALRRFRPHYVIGYSVALDLFARVNRKLAADFHSVDLKVVVGAAEGFPRDDSPKLLEEVFSAPLTMEYGSVETDLIAHGTPQGGYDVFWGTYFCEALETGVTGGKIIRVTSLYPRCFPLIRYELGDEIELEPGEEGLGVARFQSVRGRCHDTVTLADGTILHSEAFSHAVRPCPEIRYYQIVDDQGTISLNYIAPEPITDEQMLLIRQRLSKINLSLKNIEIKRVDKLEQTVAGKTKMVVRK